MELKELAGMLDLSATIVLIVVVLRQQEKIVLGMLPSFEKLFLAVLTDNSERWKTVTENARISENERLDKILEMIKSVSASQSVNTESLMRTLRANSPVTDTNNWRDD